MPPALLLGRSLFGKQGSYCWTFRIQQGVTHITLVTIITKETNKHFPLAHRVNRDKMRLIFAMTCFFKLLCIADSPWSTDVSKEVRSLEVAWPEASATWCICP